MKKRLISIVLCITSIMLCIPVLAAEFNDVPNDAWYYEAVYYCAEKGIFNGTGDSGFSPLRTISRAEFVKVLANYEGVDISDQSYNGFIDVETNSWYYNAMAWAKNEGIVSGTSNNTFSPNMRINREQLCTMMYRYLNYKGVEISVIGDDSFADDLDISDWAKESVYAIKSVGVVKGVGDNRFNPMGTATRSEAAQLMMNFDKYYAELSKEDTEDGTEDTDKKEENEFMLDDAVVDIKIEGLTKNYKFLHVSDAHLTLTDETDLPEVIAHQKDRGVAFDAQVTDGVKKEDRLANAYKYAEAEGCNSIFLTGDIIDTPSNGNIAYLESLVKGSSVHSAYVLGNHDWTFSYNPDEYQSGAQRGEHIPKFQRVFDKYEEDGSEDLWEDYVDIYEYDGLAVVAIDNSNNQIPNSATAILQNYASKNIPVILLLHVPISVPTMVQDVSAMWGRDICLGAANLAPNATTQRFINYLKSAESPVKAILAGHIHMDHVDDISSNNDTVQYTLGATYQGAARIFNIHG
ncbi:MAG: S-layer homology domain-containing protein [Clostridia bacterium]|nr:S-layer homology domain-containing protein [Clostridia bacterium]